MRGLRQPYEVLHKRRGELEHKLNLGNDDSIVMFDIGVLVFGKTVDELLEHIRQFWLPVPIVNESTNSRDLVFQ